MSKEKQIEEMMNFLYNPYLIPIYGDCEDVVNALYNAGHRKATEVAREIFEDIEKIDEDTVSFQEFYSKIMKLKKKYTEGKEWTETDI